MKKKLLNADKKRHVNLSAKNKNVSLKTEHRDLQKFVSEVISIGAGRRANSHAFIRRSNTAQGCIFFTSKFFFHVNGLSTLKTRKKIFSQLR